MKAARPDRRTVSTRGRRCRLNRIQTSYERSTDQSPRTGNYDKRTGVASRFSDAIRRVDKFMAVDT